MIIAIAYLLSSDGLASTDDKHTIGSVSRVLRNKYFVASKINGMYPLYCSSIRGREVSESMY
jgi:hypothetical protein